MKVAPVARQLYWATTIRLLPNQTHKSRQIA